MRIVRSLTRKRENPLTNRIIQLQEQVFACDSVQKEMSKLKIGMRKASIVIGRYNIWVPMQ